MPALQNKTNTPGILPLQEKKKEKENKKHASNPRCKMEHPLSQTLVKVKRKWKSRGKATETHTNKATRLMQPVSFDPGGYFLSNKQDEKLLLQLPAVLAQITWNALPFVDLPIVLNFWYLPSAPITSNRCKPMDPSV
jgi:hypothetical protein